MNKLFISILIVIAIILFLLFVNNRENKEIKPQPIQNMSMRAVPTPLDFLENFYKS